MQHRSEHVPQRAPTWPLRSLWWLVLLFGLVAVATGFSLIVHLAGQREVPAGLAATAHVRQQLGEVRDAADALAHAPEGRVGEARRLILETKMSDAADAHRALMALDPNGELFAPFDGDAPGRLQRALGHTARQLEVAQELLEAGKDHTPDGRELPAYVLALARQYLITLDHIDLQANRASEQALAEMQRFEGVLMVLCGLALVATAAWVLRSVSGTIDRYVRRLARTNAELRESRTMLAEAVVAVGQLSEERRALLRAVGHDIRAPLQSAVLAAQLAEHKPAEARRYLERVAHNARRVSEIVGHAASYEGAWLTAAEDVGAVVESVVTSFASQAETKGLTLTCEIEGPIMATTDAAALSRVLENLVSNAIKYTPGGWVRVRARVRGAPPNQRILIDVEDSGPGIPDHDLETIFVPGHRLQSDEQGEGMGLALARQLAQERLGGLLEVHSAVGRGSVFTLLLPLYHAGRPSFTELDPHGLLLHLQRAGAFADLRVVVLGESPLRETLALSGAEMLPYRSGADVLRKVDLLVLDLDMLAPQGLASLGAELDAMGADAPPLVVAASQPPRLGLPTELAAHLWRWRQKPVNEADVLTWLIAVMRHGSGFPHHPAPSADRATRWH